MNAAAWVMALTAFLAVGVVALIGTRSRWWRVSESPQIGLPTDTQFIYTTHVRLRMGQRNVASTQIEEALTQPDRRELDETKRSMRFEKDHDGRTLKVWVVADPWPPPDTGWSPGDRVVIKTTAWKYFDTFRIPAGAVGRVIGRAGATIADIRRSTGAQMFVDRDGVVRISAGERGPVDRATQRIKAIVEKSAPGGRRAELIPLRGPGGSSRPSAVARGGRSRTPG